MPGSRSPLPANLLNRCGSRSGGTPRPSSATEIATCSPSRSASTRIGEEPGEYAAAFANRLFSTCSMRRRSAITGGRSGGRSSSTWCAPPPLRNVVRAWSTSAVTSDGSGHTESVPVSMRPASSRSPISPLMRSA